MVVLGVGWWTHKVSRCPIVKGPQARRHPPFHHCMDAIDSRELAQTADAKHDQADRRKWGQQKVTNLF